MSEDIHVYPLNDLREHITNGPGCPCKPSIEVLGPSLLYIHNAWDHREIVEQAIDVLNGVDDGGQDDPAG